jgi:hypothetical protein
VGRWQQQLTTYRGTWDEEGKKVSKLQDWGGGMLIKVECLLGIL